MIIFGVRHIMEHGHDCKFMLSPLQSAGRQSYRKPKLQLSNRVFSSAGLSADTADCPGICEGISTIQTEKFSAPDTPALRAAITRAEAIAAARKYGEEAEDRA
ncbi:MAG: hypothetical protein K2O32_09130 [Acetatifactor sp.]|nr:hypothetical protein [Acetatifactor sp.]